MKTDPVHHNISKLYSILSYALLLKQLSKHDRNYEIDYCFDCIFITVSIRNS